ncbi:MAG: hypothetical protein EXR71_13855 [Myxococcales bacterium]|nr:hypothetical protein [Myxococcales bacterium]
MSPDALVAEMTRRYLPNKVPRALVYYLSIGENKYTMRLDAGACTITQGKVEGADCVIKAHPDVFENLVIKRKAPGPLDIARGRFKTNDVALLALLGDCFR